MAGQLAPELKVQKGGLDLRRRYAEQSNQLIDFNRDGSQPGQDFCL
jgi:hypothetical protein